MSDAGLSGRADDRLRLEGWVPLVAVVVVALGLLLGCTVVFPRYLAASDVDHAKVSPTELAQARNDVRTTLLQGFGGMVLLLGAYLTWRQTQISRAASRDELRLSREGQLTDRFTRAVEQLGERQRRGSRRRDLRAGADRGGIHRRSRVDRGPFRRLRAEKRTLAAGP